MELAPLPNGHLSDRGVLRPISSRPPLRVAVAASSAPPDVLPHHIFPVAFVVGLVVGDHIRDRQG